MKTERQNSAYREIQVRQMLSRSGAFAFFVCYEVLMKLKGNVRLNQHFPMITIPSAEEFKTRLSRAGQYFAPPEYGDYEYIEIRWSDAYIRVEYVID